MVMLIVEIGLQCKFGATALALEASRMKEGKIFERANTIHLIDDIFATQTGGLVEVWTIHFTMLVYVSG